MAERARAAGPARGDGTAAEARHVLKSVFGYDDFRPGQEEIVGWILGGEDVLAVMPTGSGKSHVLPAPGGRRRRADRRRLAADRADARPGARSSTRSASRPRR